MIFVCSCNRKYPEAEELLLINVNKFFFFPDVSKTTGSNSIISPSSSLFGGSLNHSPVPSTPIPLSNCVPEAATSLQQSNGGQLHHSSYVDQRGRSTLINPTTPARELPV